MPISAYNSPGVTVTESVNPSVSPLLATVPGICIVGTARGFQTQVDRFVLTGSGVVNLSQTGAITSSLTVTDTTTGNLVANPGSYSLVQTSNPDGVANSGDETYTIARFAPAASAPTLAQGTGSLNGVYEYAVTLLNANGETGIGPASSTIALANQGTTLTNIPLGGAGTTGRNIYRAKVVAGVVGTFNLVSTLNDNTTTTVSNESTSDAAAALNPTPPNGVNSGDNVLVQYNYTNVAYYQPTLFNNFNDVVDKYGPPFDSSGNILNPLTFAIRLAFVNGAQQIIGMVSKSSSASDYSNAFAVLLSDPDVKMISVTSGSTAVHSALQSHVSSAATNGFFRIGVIGQDSSSGPVAVATLRTAAQAFNSENMILVSPSSFTIINPVSLVPYPVGAQYMACAVLGMFGARDVSVPLTRKIVSGFYGPYEIRTVSDAALDSATGLCVVEAISNNTLLRVRQSVTTAANDSNKREASVVRAKYEMAHQLMTILDSTMIGIVLPVADAPAVVATAVQNILQQLSLVNVIDSYQNITARQLASDPTTIEVAFEYTPFWPINNIQVTFTINTQTGQFALTTL